MSAAAPASREAPRWLLAGVLLLLAVAPGQLAHALDPKHGPFIAYADLVALAVIGLWGVWSLATGRLRQLPWPPRQTWALVIVAVLSGLGAESPKLAALEIIQLVLYFVLAYMLFADVLRGERRTGMALRVMLAATSVVILYGFAQYLRATDPSAVKATFQSRSAYGAFLVMVLPLFFGVLLRSARLGERLWAGAALTLGSLTILSPGLLLVLVAVLGAVTVAWSKWRTQVVYAVVAIAFCLVTMQAAPLNRAVWRETVNPYEEGDIYKLMDGGATDVAADQVYVKKRWIEWMPALNMMSENFLLGVGTGNYQLNIGRPEYYGFLPNVKKSEADTNNLYLVTGGSMGFAGLAALLGFVGYFARRAANLWTRLEGNQQRMWAAGLCGLALAVPLVNVFSSTFVRGTSLVWAVGYALIAVMGASERTSGSTPGSASGAP